MDEHFYRPEFESSYFPASIQAKWPGVLLEEGFVPFPKKVLRCIHQILEGKDALELLCVILAIADFKRAPHRGAKMRAPSAKYLAFIAGLPEEKFISLLKKLEDKKLVQVRTVQGRLDISLEGLIVEVEKRTTDMTA